ncbi:DNA replication complex GINS protein PSF3-like isoform X2 [Impatiens glandulifera]|uniref:DNA replication complex GINS protein PSF3-like isoform X2 n=1 Tax=Impatiens glandulifera TaxID=253017 RepID=UPI001FB17484|nr:DNA replication complex GINS protein PSF3-like isoform X2 [Impatiens glandulifera]
MVSKCWNQVEQGTKVELPFWLARELQLRQAVSVDIPMCFNKKTKDEIIADAAHVDLRTRSPYFYELGLKIEPIVGDKTIRNLLLGAFAIRYKDVLVKAQTTALALAPKMLTLLTKEEMKLYEAAQSSLIAFKKWRMGGPRFQRASVLGRKRRSNE